jgi:hypothetical protein
LRTSSIWKSETGRNATTTHAEDDKPWADCSLFNPGRQTLRV